MANKISSNLMQLKSSKDPNIFGRSTISIDSLDNVNMTA